MRQLIRVSVVVILSALSAGAGALALDQPASNSSADSRSRLAYSSGRKTQYELDVPGDKQWTDSGIDLLAGDQLVITATGSIEILGKQCGPEGLARGWMDLLRVPPVPDAGHGALIGRVGNTEAAQPFAIGQRREMRVAYDGRLFLGINEQSSEQADGKFHVKVQITPGPGGAKAMPNLAHPGPAPTLPTDTFQRIPRRIGDKDGHPGDMVNFLIIGSEDRMNQAFESAGWVHVDRTTSDAVLHGIIASVSKESYTQMPMSTLYLFGRPQDFGFAHADPLSVVATRHHLRLWKAPFAVNGQTLWVGAATHDIGFERDQRNGGITHKIDPDVDKEREFVAESFLSTGLVTQLGYVTPPNPLTEAKTATGGSFNSDGRVLVMALSASGADRSSAFASMFCTVLQQEHPDPGTWGDCSQYVQATGQGTAALSPLPATKYRVLILPGILNPCIGKITAFQEGQAHLREKYGMTVEYLTLPNESSESNGKVIADYVKAHQKGDSRKYIVVSYSKGAPDFQEALAQSPQIASAVAAFITVAGAVGGSPIADTLPIQAKQWIQALHLGSCEGDLTAAFKSLGKAQRQAFLASHANLVVPTISFVALSDRSSTSKMLLQSWQLLSVYDSEEDSQLTKSDAIVPGAIYLGAAKADHLAIALPFEDSGQADIRTVLDHNHYPREALLEALVRYAIQDVEKGEPNAGTQP